MSANGKERVFYIYVHFRPDLTPFYVGKGKGDRCGQFWGRSQYHHRVVEKYGKENIIIEKVMCNSEMEAFAREIETINRFRLQGFTLCNLSNGGEGPSGVVHSPQTIQKMKTSHAKVKTWVGKKHTEESKMKMALAHTGKTLSEEAKKKISEFHQGKQWCLGKKLTDEHKEKISKGCQGKCPGGRPKGYKHSDEAKKKCSESLKGHHVSEETRAKLSLAAKEQWRKKRECLA